MFSHKGHNINKNIIDVPYHCILPRVMSSMLNNEFEDESLASQIESQDVVMKGVASPLYKAQHLRLSN